MSISSHPATATLFSPSRERQRILLLVLGSLLIFSAGIGMRALWNPNESVYGEGVREMISRGDYYVPWVNGRIYSDKPIFYFWTLLISAGLSGGLSEVSLRIPSVASGVLSVMLVYLLGRKLFGIRAGFLAAFCLSTSVMFWWHSQFVQMDQLLSMLILGALVLLFLAKEIPGRGAGISLVGSGALMGLAFLTKGPVGLVLPVGVFGLYLISCRELGWILRKETLWLGGTFLLVASPWYISLALNGHTEVLYDFFIKHNFQRATDPFNHQRPFYHYGPRFLSDLFPWSLLIPIAFWAPCRNELERRGRRFLRIWLTFIFLLFSAAGSKRGVYILPLYPAAALLAGKYWDEFLSEGLTPPMSRLMRRLGWGFLAFVAGFFVLGGLAPSLIALNREEYRAELGPLVPLTLLTLAGGMLLIHALRHRRAARGVAVVGLTMAGVFLYAGLFLFPVADRYKSPVGFVRTMEQHVGEQDELRSYGLWRWDSAYIYYMERLMPAIRSRAELKEYLSQERKVFLLVESTEIDETLAGLETPVRELVRQKIGHKHTALVTNRLMGD